MDAQYTYVRYAAQRRKDVNQGCIRQHQGISSGEDDLVHFPVLPDVVESLIYGALRDLRILVDAPFSHAKTTIYRALVGNQENDAARVTVDNLADGRLELFMQRVGVRLDIIELSAIRKNLPGDGIIGRLNQRDEMRADPHGEEVYDILQTLRVDAEMGRQLIKCCRGHKVAA